MNTNKLIFKKNIFLKFSFLFDFNVLINNIEIMLLLYFFKSLIPFFNNLISLFILGAFLKNYLLMEKQLAILFSQILELYSISYHFLVYALIFSPSFLFYGKIFSFFNIIIKNLYLIIYKIHKIIN